MNNRLRLRLINWGCWLNHESHIGPKGARCTSIESHFTPELGEVWEPDTPRETPDVSDAEAIQQLIRTLDQIEQHCLAVRYGGMPSVFRFRRISGQVQNKMADNAETLLADMLIESA